MNALLALLRTPRGLAWLVGLTVLGAVALALAMAANLPFFEGTRKLVYPEPTGRTVLAAQQLERGELAAGALGAQARRDLVRYYLIDDPSLGDRAWMPAALADAVPAALGDEVERALLAGTPEQVERALVLAERSGAAATREVLSRAARRARDRHQAELTARIERALAGADPAPR